MTSRLTSSAGTPVRFGFRLRLALIQIAVAAVAIGTVGYFAHQYVEVEARRQTQENLTRDALAGRDRVARFFGGLQAAVTEQAALRSTRDALNDLSAARAKVLDDLGTMGFPPADLPVAELQKASRDYYADALGANLSRARAGAPVEGTALMPPPESTLLQYVYTVANPAPAGAKHEKVSGKDIASFATLDARLRIAFSFTDFVRSTDRAQSTFDELRKRGGYRNVYLIDRNGWVVFSARKELDLAQNVTADAMRATGLGQVVAQLTTPAKTTGESPPAVAVALSDLAAYPYANDAPVWFVAAPVSSPSGERLGALVYQVAADALEGALRAPADGAVSLYLAGEDLRLRSDPELPAVGAGGDTPRIYIAADGTQAVPTRVGEAVGSAHAVKRALTAAGGSADAGLDEFITASGEVGLAGATRLNVLGRTYAVVAEINRAAALAPADAFLRQLAGVGAAVLLVVILVAIYLAHRVARPILALSDATAKLAAGHDFARARVYGSDEVAQIATRFNVVIGASAQRRSQFAGEPAGDSADLKAFVAAGRRWAEGDFSTRIPPPERTDLRLLVDQINALVEARQQPAPAAPALSDEERDELLQVLRRAAAHDLSGRVSAREGPVGEVATALNHLLDEVGTLVTDVQAQARQLAGVAEQVLASTKQLGQDATQQHADITSTAALVQSMAATIDTLSAEATTASAAAGRAGTAVTAGAAAMQQVTGRVETIRENVWSGAKKLRRLGDRAREINALVSTIEHISAQTDILSLNATIEATHAGEQGRGFVVVAEEVRKLAEQAAGATQEITRRVLSIQSEAAESVAALDAQIEHVEAGTKAVSAADAALESIRGAVAEMTGLTESIARAAQEQTVEVQWIIRALGAVNQLAQTAKDGTASADESLADLTRLTRELQERATRFRIQP